MRRRLPAIAGRLPAIGYQLSARSPLHRWCRKPKAESRKLIADR